MSSSGSSFQVGADATGDGDAPSTSATDIAVRACFFLVMALLAGSWGELSRVRYIGPVALIGVGLLWRRRPPTRADARLYAWFVTTQLLVLISAALYQDAQAILFHALVLLALFPFIQSFLVAYGMDKAGLYGLCLGIVPYTLPEVFGLGGAAIQDLFDSGARPLRYVGLRGDPNYTALGLMPVFAATLLLILNVRRLWRVVGAALIAVLIAAIVATGSRAGIGAMGFALLGFLVITSVQSRRNFLIGVAVLAAILYAVATRMADYVSFFFTRIDDGSAMFADDRYKVWASVLQEVLSDAPLNHVPEESIVARFGYVVHNFLLDLGLTFGSGVMLVHAVVWAAGFVTLTIKCWRAVASGRPLATSIHAVGLLLLVPALMVASTLTVGRESLYWLMYMILWSIAWTRGEPDTHGREGAGPPAEPSGAL